MTAAVPSKIPKEIDLEFAVSNRIDALMKKNTAIQNCS